MFGSCGGYYAGNQAYKDKWLNNLRGLALYLGVTVFASPGPLTPNLQYGFEAFKAQGGDRSPLFGFTPGGKRFTTVVPPLPGP